MMTSTMTAMMTWVEAEQMALQMLKVPLLPLLCLGCPVTRHFLESQHFPSRCDESCCLITDASCHDVSVLGHACLEG